MQFDKTKYKIDQLRARVTELEEELRNANAEIETLRAIKGGDTLRARIAELNDDVTKLAKENARFRTALAEILTTRNNMFAVEKIAREALEDDNG